MAKAELARLAVALAEWFAANEIPFTLLDLDTENKARGSLKHFFNGSVAKVNIHTPAGLDAFVDHLESGAAIILADIRAGDGVHADWLGYRRAFHRCGCCHVRPGKVLRVSSPGRTDCRVGHNI